MLVRIRGLELLELVASINQKSNVFPLCDGWEMANDKSFKLGGSVIVLAMHRERRMWPKKSAI